MTGPWAADFTYAYFARLMAAAAERLAPVSFVELARRLESDGAASGLLLRHDVDLDLERAVRLARVEQEHGIASTYMVMTTCPLYRVEDAASRRALRQLRELGHDVGLHFDAEEEGEAGGPEDLERAIGRECDRLADALGEPVESLSFHRPQPEFLRGQLHLAGRVNAYAAQLMQWYLSDSKGSWREGEPIDALNRPRGRVLQLLTHPIWWDVEHARGPTRLQGLFEERTSGMDDRTRERFDRDMRLAVPAVQRSGASALA